MIPLIAKIMMEKSTEEISTNFIILSHNKIINNAEVLYKDGSNN